MLLCKRLDELPLHDLQHGERSIQCVHTHGCNLASSEQFTGGSIHHSALTEKLGSREERGVLRPVSLSMA